VRVGQIDKAYMDELRSNVLLTPITAEDIAYKSSTGRELGDNSSSTSLKPLDGFKSSLGLAHAWTDVKRLKGMVIAPYVLLS